ncbi:MAG: zinc-dependent metalloprotease [Planctomycetota bacterium]
MTHAKISRACRAVLAATALLAVTAPMSMPASAQEAPADATTEGELELTAAEVQALMAARRGATTSSSSGYTAFEKVIEGLKLVEAPEGTRGLFKLYRPAGNDAKSPSKLIAAIPPSLFGKDLLLAASVSAGPLAGYQWNDYLVRFERRGRNVVLVVPDLSQVSDDKRKPVAESVERTYTPRILASMPIQSVTGSGELAVDLSALTGAIPVPGATGPLRKDLSRYTTVKVFPENVLITAELAYGRGAGATTTGMSYAFRQLPNLNTRDRYRPRLADERVGYFLTVKQDWSSGYDDRDLTDRYINRWRLEKLDPSLEMSPPKEPIVFYIENTVPVQWRRYVRDGVEEWNKAFEKVGIVGAIEVRQQTDTAYADIDPEDARYNFIRWIVTGRAFAMGPSRVDPRTGQILDADIIFDDSMLRYFSEDLDLLGPKTMLADMGPEFLTFLDENPAFMPQGVTEADVHAAMRSTNLKWQTTAGSNFATNVDPNAQREALNQVHDMLGTSGCDHGCSHPVVASRNHADHAGCNYATGVRQQLAMTHWLNLSSRFAAVTPPMPKGAPTTKPGAATAKDSGDAGDGGAIVSDPVAEVEEEVTQASASAETTMEEVTQEKAEAKTAEVVKREKVKLPEKFLGLVLKDVVAHEVGHTIGLRHNFKASAWLSLDEIKERRGDADKPLVASVMDYNPMVFFAGDDPSDLETFSTSVIGPYDYWAVEYGYTIANPRQEKQVTAQIAAKSGKRELAYATDEDTTGLASPDPFVNRYDLGDDPIAFAKARAELADYLMEDLREWALEKNSTNDELRDVFRSLFFEKIRNANFVARMVGGQKFSRTRFGETLDGGDEPGLTLIDPDAQREAIAYLDETLFNDEFFAVETELWNDLVPSRQPTVGSWAGSRIDFPVHQTILNAQNRALSTLVNPTILQRVYDAELKTTEDDKFTAAELITSVTEAVWGEIGSEELSSIDRNLQSQHLDYLTAMAMSEPGRLMAADLRNMVRYQLRMLAKDMDEAIAEGDLDMATAAHYAESKSTIERALEAPMVDVAGGGQTIIMMGREASK